MNFLGDLDAKYDGLCERLDALNLNLERVYKQSDQRHSPQLREWERFVLIDGGVCAANTATVGGNGSQLKPCANGWEAYVTSIAVTLSGASAAATVAVYNGDVSAQNLLDYGNSMLGNTPSRLVAFYDPETVYVEQSDSLTVVVAAAAGTDTVVVRVTGKRRQV